MGKKGIIKILDKFEGAMIANYIIKDNNIYMELKKEKPTFGFRNKKFDYNLHFHFGLHNQSKKDEIYNIFIECDNNNDLHHPMPRLWISGNIDEEYKLVNNIDGKTDFHGKYCFTVHLVAGQLLYIANFPPIKFSRLNKIFQDLAAKSNAKEIIVGRTVENRCIKAYEYGDLKNKPTILFVAGFHPPERDTVAIIAIMEKLSNNNKWKEEIFESYSFSVIPILNPDGFANAMQGSNINEINFHWKFFGHSIDECPEANSIWEYCLRIKPIVFFDFHAFTFQDNNAMIYWIPKGYYVSKKVRRIQNDLNKRLKELCRGKFSTSEKILAPNLLSTKLRNDIGTLTSPKFHLHMKDGINKSKEMAIMCLEIVLSVLRYHKIKSSTEILKKPYGKIKSHIQDEIRIRLLNYWYFRLKSIYRKILGN